MTDVQSTTPTVKLRRTYPVPRARVFAAWTTPAVLLRFFSDDEIKGTDAQLDARPGGAFRIALRHTDGEDFIARGIYREVVVPERLVMTWRWEEDDPADEHESLLTLEFFERAGATELVLTHAKLASPESRDRHEAGWTGMIDRLSTVLES